MASTGESDIFNPNVHLVKAESISTFTFADLRLATTGDKEDVAGSRPFQLLSREGVLAYRRAILRPDVLQACGRRLGKGTLALRNVASKSKFITDLWTSPVTTEIVRRALQSPVEIIMPMEIGHTNIQITGKNASLDNLRPEPSTDSTPLTDEELRYDPLSADSVIPWHYDSYPYVCIIMLSDTTSMVGGHTYIRDGDGSAHKVEGPCMGTAVVLQGGQVEHLASRAFGSAERITTISSYKLAQIGRWDDSFINNVRTYDLLPDLYSQWSLYRLQKMREEIAAMEVTVQESMEAQHRIDHDEVESLCLRLSQYAMRTTRQMVCPEIRDTALTRFGFAAVVNAKGLWNKVRVLPKNYPRIIKATAATIVQMPEMRPYMLDWYQTKAQMELGVGGREMDSIRALATAPEYFFPDELARQGLHEALILWLANMGQLEVVPDKQ